MAHSPNYEKAHVRESDYELDDSRYSPPHAPSSPYLYTPTRQMPRTPSLYSFEPERVYGNWDRSTLTGSSTPNSYRAYTPNQAFASTARLALDDKSYSSKYRVSVPRADTFAADFTTFATTYPDHAYSVDVTAPRDDFDHLPAWRRRLYRLSPLSTILAVGAYWAYFTIRILYTIYAQKAYKRVFIMAWFFIIAEMIVAFPAIVHQLWQLTAIRGRKRKQLRLRGDFAPTINVLITCCKEDVDIIIDTARAACCVDYPRDRFRVTICDDGNDPELRAAADALKEQYPNLYYNARVKVKGVPHHFKAGNLIASTEFVATLEGGPAEFLAALDADMIPEPDWLRSIIAHLAIDPKLALACPPQLFYNIPDNDPLVQSLDGFVHAMETVKDASGVAWCTGSGYAVRITALESIGGWPTGSLAEDVCTSSMLLGGGWKTAYVHEPLQWGTVPEDYASHLKQRTRWTLGTLQTAKKLNFFLFGKLIGKMTFFQRLSGFVFMIDAYFKIFFVISILTFPIVLISGNTMVAYATTDQLRMQARFCFLALFFQRINEFIMALPAGYRQQTKEGIAMLWMAPYHAITVVRSFLLPKWLGGKSVAFTSSGSIASVLNERNPALRANVFRRLKVIIWDCKAFMHVGYILFVVAAVTLSTYRAFSQHNNVNDILLYLVTHTAWPPLLWLVALVSFWTPIHYALFPPSIPEREELLDRNHKTGVAHPKPEWKAQRWNGFSWFYEVQYSLLTLFTCFIFVTTFFITDNMVAPAASGPAGPNGPAFIPGGNGGGTSNPTGNPLAPSVPSGPINMCGQFQGATTDSGAYIVETNQWGMDDSGAQCLYYDPDRVADKDATAFTTTWSWAANINMVHSYPNVLLVSKDLPIAVSDLSQLNYDVDWTMAPGDTAAATTTEADLVSSAVKANVAFDCFLDVDKDHASNASLAGYEFMVWMGAYGGVQPLGWLTTPDVIVSELGGGRFTLYSAANEKGQMVHSWYPDEAMGTFNADVSSLLQYLVQEKLIPDNAYLGSVQFGTETTHSVGNVTFDASKVSMQLVKN